MKAALSLSLLLIPAVGFMAAPDLSDTQPETTRPALPADVELRAAASPFQNQSAIDDAEAMLDSAVALENDDLILSLSDRLLRLVPNHPDALREPAGVYLRRKQAEQARAAAMRYVQARPEDPMSHLCLADACSLSCPGETQAASAAIAAQHLAIAKTLSKSSWDIDNEQDLADSLETSGDLRGARLSYLSLARMRVTTPFDRAMLLEHADELGQQANPHILFSTGALLESEGHLIGFDVEAIPFCGPRWAFGLRAHEDRLSAYSGPRIAGQANRTEVAMVSRLPLSPSWMWTAQIGALAGATTHASAGTALKRTMESGLVYGVSANYNQRSSDSLPMIYAGGRQSRIAFEGEIPLSPSLTIEANAGLREVESDIHRVGWGHNEELALAWRILKSQPSISLRYEWEHASFKVDRGFAAKADPGEYVLNEINTHLVVLQLKRTFGRITPSLRLAAGYRFAQHTPEYGVAIYTAYRLNDDVKLTFGYEYDSAGMATANTSDTHFLSIAFNATF